MKKIVISQYQKFLEAPKVNSLMEKVKNVYANCFHNEIHYDSDVEKFLKVNHIQFKIENCEL